MSGGCAYSGRTRGLGLSFWLRVRRIVKLYSEGVSDCVAGDRASRGREVVAGVHRNDKAHMLLR